MRKGYFRARAVYGVKIVVGWESKAADERVEVVAA
jgi:hypothetical protein